MCDSILKQIANTPFSEGRGSFSVDDSIGISLVLAASFKHKPDNYLVVASNLYKAQKIANFLSSFLSKDDVLLFPADELIRAETLAQSKEMVASRLFALDQLQNGEPHIVICNVSSFLRYLPSPSLFNQSVLEFKVGECYDLLTLKNELVRNGYNHVSKIDQSLQFASRGNILDIFSVNLDNPVRIEFFDDEVESIRFFDVASQTSFQAIDKVRILPANDILFSEEELRLASDKLYERLEKDKLHKPLGDFQTLLSNIEELISTIKDNQLSSDFYKYYSFLKVNPSTLIDYCKDFKKVYVDKESILESNRLLQDESLSYLSELHSNNLIISHLEMFKDLSSFINLSGTQAIVTSSLLLNDKCYSIDIRHVPYQGNKRSDAINIVSTYLKDGFSINISIKNLSNKELLIEELNQIISDETDVEELERIKNSINFIDQILPIGFVLNNEKVVYLTDHELFNDKVRITRFDNRFKEATILKSFEDLNPGDYVVHETQGIAQFVSLETLEVDGSLKDYLKLAFHGGEILYIPLGQFALVRKYLGKEGASPRLSRLHTKDWENTKKRIKERVNLLAERLMNLYLERSKKKGFAFNQDDEFSRQFENAFPYDLTKDQERSLNEIKRDMESDISMDRLLCGDVGFGKTEVAFRAAFKAINSGKQVALLCPTTLLARQHYELALSRFSQFDIRIAVFSRLIPQSIQNKYIEDIAKGKIHLIIGTHRLLSKSIVYKDLGLLIIDEEQRFGVEHKERIKELKSDIDVLTLSATPIPRTLQISLLGVRSLSKIDTPPEQRMPIQTYVTPYREDIIKELIERELGRHGQVFYLHNNIGTLYECAARLQKMLPSIRIACAHGRLDREEVEDIMIAFYKGDIDVLVCTSIIENGIDVPNANMIIVDNCIAFGLSQLYQIKGRVGRSSRIAYAYLLYNGRKELNENAKKRLKAIQEFTELGSGYKIAQRDLMIRGAGDILGPDQAGFIDSIGLDMYIRSLNEAVQEKVNGPSKEVDNKTPLLLDAYIPSSYLNSSDKIQLYQEIINAKDSEMLFKIKKKTIDIFGKLPSEVEILFDRRNVELLKRDAGVDELKETPQCIDIILNKSFLLIRGIGNIIFEAMIPYLKVIKISYVNSVFKISLAKTKTYIKDLEHILTTLVDIYKNNKVKEVH